MGLQETLGKTRAYARYKFLKTERVHTAWGGWKTKIFYEARYYSCLGKLLWATIVHGWLEGHTKLRPLVDMRSLELTAKGCCPPALMKDFIMQEGGEMAERDPVLEAMKLHKRGYFGGGG